MSCYECKGLTPLGSYKVIDDNTMVLCKKCYDWHTSIARSGLPTKEEVINNSKKNNEYGKDLKDYQLLLKKYMKNTKTRPKDMLRNILKLEKELSLSVFNKTRECLSFEEHQTLMQLMISNNDLYDYEGVKISNEDTLEDKFVELYNERKICDIML